MQNWKLILSCTIFILTSEGETEGEDDSASEEEGKTEGEGNPIPEEEKESEEKNDPVPEEEGEAEEEDDPGLEDGGDGSGTGDAEGGSLEQKEEETIPEQEELDTEVDFPEFEYAEDLDGVTITLTAEEGVLPEGTIVKIEALSSEIRETSGDIGQSFCYDITLYDENEEKLDNSWKQNGTVLVSFSGQRIEAAKEAAARAEISYIDGSGKEELIETILLSGKETAAAVDRETEDVESRTESEDEAEFLMDREPFFEEPEICFEATHFSVYRLTFVERRTTETENLDDYLVDDTVSPADIEFNLFRYETEEENPDTELDDDSLQKLFDPDIHLTGKTSYKDVKGLFQKDGKGYYYYVSEKNYAAYDTEEQTFRLYDGAAIIDDTAQFLPFTAAEDVFEKSEVVLEESRPKLQVKPGFALSEIKYNSGLSLKVGFYQRDGGTVETNAGNWEDMEFQFSGDDVWVYIDGVLVADSGGVWTINFWNGEIRKNDRKVSSLQEKFEKANASTDFSSHGTFQNDTFHTLEFFYLGRANQKYGLRISYNLVPTTADAGVQSAPTDTVVVLDQDNHLIEGAEFELYRANDSYETTGEPLAGFTTDESGTWEMEDESGTPYDFKGYYEADQDQAYYVLRETDTPAGYRPVPDIYLMYNPEDDVLKVMNPWNTGAAGNFSAEVYRTEETLKYQNEDGQGASQEISLDKTKKGIVLAVPMTIVKRSPDGSPRDKANWRPIYGANLDRFMMADTNQSAANNTETMRKRILKAALYQIHASQNDPEHYQSWYLSWSDEENGYLGTLSDLPGTPDRYYHTAEDTNADLAMVYYFVDGSVLDGAGDAESKLEKLETAVSDALKDHETLDAAIDEAADELLSSFRQLNPECFQSSYGSLIYIPQAVNTLAVQAVDEDGNPLEGVEFTLYGSDHDTAYASGTTDSEGRLLFSAAADEDTQGQVKVPLVPNGAFGNDEAAYYLKVTDEKQKNDTEIPVYVTTDRGVYADAGTAEDKVSVQTGLGKLLGTMTRYAAKDGINATLRDITFEAGGAHTHTQKGEDDKELALHYGLDSALLDYGVHEENILPVLITEEEEAFGYAYQNYNAHSDGDGVANTYSQELDPEQELSALFTGSTTVVVGCVEEETPPVTPPVTPPEEGDGDGSGDGSGGDPENEDGSGDPGDGDSSHSTGGNSGSHSSGGSSGCETGSSRSSVPAYYTRGIWSEDENGWTFRRGDGTAAISGWIYTDWNGEYGWYYFDENGRMKTGWLEYEGETYYLNPESAGTRGRMITGWKEIDGKWYYFSDISDGKRGKMLKDTETPDGYQLGVDGVWIR